MKYQHLDLFSGIGGFSLGLEATGGFETVAFCEIEDFPRKVLTKHWPNVPIYGDIKELNYDRLKADGIISDTKNIDILTGGYPCSPFSISGLKKGEEDPRYLWPEMFRLVKELRPSFIIGENVAHHIKLGLDTVLQDLESEGYSTSPISVSAASVGAVHQRERIWIVAHLEDTRRSLWPRAEQQGENENETRQENANQFERSSSSSKSNVANTQGDRLLSGSGEICGGESEWLHGNEKANRNQVRSETSSRGGFQREISWSRWWESEPNVGRVAHGVPKRVDRLKGLGNSVVPAIPYYIGCSILESLEEKDC